MKCQRCGYENNNGQQFCGNCGIKLEHLQSKEDKNIINNNIDKSKKIKMTTCKIKAIWKKLLKKVKNMYIIAFLILALVGGFSIYNKFFSDSRDSRGRSGVLNKNSNMTEVILQQKLLDIGELATAKYSYTDEIHLKNNRKIKKWNIPLTTKKFTITYDGIVKAGYEIDKIRIKLDESKKEVSIIFPDIKIFDCYIDSKKILDEKDTIFNQIKMEDSVDMDEYLKCSLKLHALKKDILKKADENACNLIYDSLKTVVKEDWDIVPYDSTHTVDYIKKVLLDKTKKEYNKYKKMFDEE